ncbi:MAG: ATP-binding protein [Opitutaceae bacterium]|nr:ATP-binding protein [Opitutaceae bacterium]
MIRSWSTRTLRFRLAAWYATGGILLLSTFSAVIYAYVAYRIARPLDLDLHSDLEVVRRQLTISEAGTLSWRGSPLTANMDWSAEEPWFELWDEQRNLVARFWPFKDSELEQLPVAPAPGRETVSVFRITTDVRVRVLSVPLGESGLGKDWMIRVLRIHRPSRDALGELLLIIVVSLPVMVVMLVIGGYLITKHWLKPLETMVVEAKSITASDLSRRLPVTSEVHEFGELSRSFNVTLARLEDSFRALDRFVADAAHELLTPLTTLRSVGEVGLRLDRPAEHYREVIESMLEEAQRLQLLVEKLLQLARAEGGADIAERSPVRVDLLAARCAEDAQLIAEEHGQRIDTGLVPCELLTDELLLRQALQNVMDNAIKYGGRGSTITLEVSLGDGVCEIAVSDEGPGISASYRGQLMSRFFRADKARDRQSGGNGLGLAITKAYMRALGGRLEYKPNHPQGSVFRLLLPLHHAASPAAPPAP